MANHDLEGKIILLTGATEGIGKSAALTFARRGAHLVIVGRDADKTARVAGELRREAGRDDRVETILADLSRISEMRRAAAEFLAKHDRLDVLVNNAGALFNARKTSPDGFEMTFALNHLAYFVVTDELLGVLKKTPGARIVSTASGAHAQGNLDDLEDFPYRKNRYSGFPVYGTSKLANILFTRELGRRLEGSGVVANCFHPGFVSTGFGMNNSGVLKAVIQVGQALFARSPEKGAETLVWLAADPEAGKFNGEYFMDMKVARRTKRARDDSMAKRLWDLTEGLLTAKAA